MIAALPMYDWPEERAVTDRLWVSIRETLLAAGVAAPDMLDRRRPLMSVWSDPRLVLAQTCGLPFRRALANKVSLIGPFDFGLEDTPPGYYFSPVVVARDGPVRSLADLAGARLALNGFDSQSGWAAIAGLAQEAGLRFGELHVAGAHRDAARAVAEGRADAAALDAVTWRLIRRHVPQTAAALRVLVRTPPTPGLPLIAARRAPAGTIARAVSEALASLAEPDRQRLGIRGLVRLDEALYLAQPEPPAPARVLQRR